MADVILKADNLFKHYPIKGGVLRTTTGHVKAVDGVSFELNRGETLGIVGESGCGKSTLGRVLMRLEEPTSGTVNFDGVDMYSQSGSAMRKVRRDIQIVFQDPYTSLNPRKTVGDIIGEPFEIHPDVLPKGGRKAAVKELLDLVGLNPEHINRYPHQFSGGQRQRIGIARGIALRPKVLICDEPVSALDVSVQAQVINLMEKLQDELGLSYIFIAHDLSVVRHISDRVGVMYLGRMVELGTEEEIYQRPTHPYTQALLSAVPVPDPTMRGKREQIVLSGDVPSPANPPSGCRFHTRCFKAQDSCKVDDPELVDRPDGVAAHRSACLFAEPRVIVETIDVSDVEVDTRFASTDVIDQDAFNEDGGVLPADAATMAERSHATGEEGPLDRPHDTHRVIDNEPNEKPGPNV
ncbi:putative peptide ABC transporter, ATP-binding protein [Janibacter sp. HTCC2649]|uniref:ABC transporter ATP-binding protein n=1 Tax=Janibacter sp. HTCC2649 TaxID=313589 RepID=UPI0000670C17|nr:dipeptide ABC transporter ATP-binding protein [Janibacter sp. HTCC2649]EAP99949.1 putative peptide ABC transporter, ATP-binding protein [Janibacter sp. HTCC2649]